jgi:sec-independent protein translocase protein TatC
VADDETESEGSDGIDGRMTLVEHLTELRRRLIICAIALVVGAAIGFILYNYTFRFLAHPYTEATKGRGSCGPHGCKLVATDPLAPFITRLKVSTYSGVVIALPVLLWQLWRFITPGLNPKEKRYAIPFIGSSIVLFLMGGAVAWLTFPKALSFLIGIGGADIGTFFVADKYLTFISLMIIAFGVSFEFPVVLVFLMIAGVLKTSTLRKYRRHALVGITAFAAIITPSQDPYSLFFMAAPMYLFYECSIIIGRMLKR